MEAYELEDPQRAEGGRLQGAGASTLRDGAKRARPTERGDSPGARGPACYRGCTAVQQQAAGMGVRTVGQADPRCAAAFVGPACS